MKSQALSALDLAPAETHESARSPQPLPTFYWSVRREIWQNSSLYAVPLLAAAVQVASLFYTAIWVLQAGTVGVKTHYQFSGAMLTLSASLVGFYYCTEAVHAERRDRSILFWKSLPVSDVSAVLAKAFVPLVFLPVIVFLVGTAVQLLMLAVSSAFAIRFGVDAEVHRITSDLIRIPLGLSYGIGMITVLQAPIYGWLLLISSWARRAPALWAVLPPIALCVAEKLSFNTTHVAAALGHRFVGAYQEAFALFDSGPVVFPVLGTVAPRGPVSFLTGSDVWLGLLLTVVFIFAAARLRRHVD